MNTPTPTPRTDTAWSASFDGAQLSAGQTARALRECSQKLETELAALRDELATEREKVRLLRSALQNLADEQNGAPLERHRDEWQLAMDEARDALAATEGAK
jgi:hypothetical protein